MAQEIERKFLVIGEFKSSAFAQSHPGSYSGL